MLPWESMSNHPKCYQKRDRIMGNKISFSKHVVSEQGKYQTITESCLSVPNPISVRFLVYLLSAGANIINSFCYNVIPEVGLHYELKI